MDNIKMDLGEQGWGGMDWIDVAQDRDQWRALVNTVMNLRVPLNIGKFVSSCTTGSFSRWAELLEVSYLDFGTNQHTVYVGLYCDLYFVSSRTQDGIIRKARLFNSNIEADSSYTDLSLVPVLF
jgi:hypothetical protein